MAEAVLSPLLKVIIEKLASQFRDEVQLQRGVRKEIEKLSNTLKRIQACINDAEGREVTDESVRLWLEELKDVAYDADDTIDEFATEIPHNKPTGAENSSQENQVCRFSSPCLCLKQVMLGYKIGNRIKEIREKIDEIVKEGSQFRLREGISEKTIRAGDRMETGSVDIDSEIYGRDKDKIDIVGMLINRDIGLEMEDLSVIPIVGLGGLGKTTLAKLAYNDEQVAKHFEIKIWVCVSDDFDVKRIIRAIIESVTKNQPTISEMDPLQSHLQEVLKHRRYLLVLDDVWNEDVEKWKSIESLFRCGGKGSKIMVTTRSEKVGLIMGTTDPYRLGFLSDDDCWVLFEQRAFGRETENANPNLVRIGKEIVRKCKGVPLAAKALGSLMFFKREENDWLFVRDCEIWNLPEDQNRILPVLRLSYNHLPAHLKQCFAYCSVFPKDYVIVKEELIRQWIANGFIQSSTATSCRQAEDIGNEHFNNLLWMSFFQDVEKNEWGDILRCKMHDLVHDLAQSVATETCLVLEVDKKKSISKQARHLSLHCRDEHVAPMGSIYEAKKLRTLLFEYKSYPSFDHNVLNKMLSTFTCLRVLIISDYRRERLPASIGNLIHLRYLGIYCSGIKKLPKSIGKLKNLQTLTIDSNYFKKLPKDMSGLINLRHLDIGNCSLLTCTPSKIGDLIFLQTLPVFIVTKDRRGGIAELHNLDLRGFLNLKSLENVKNTDEARKANLENKHNLRELGFYWSRNAPTENHEQVLEGLQPHPNLKNLNIENYSGVRFSSWLMDLMLPNLVRVWLKNCKNCELLPPFGSLPSLEILVLCAMHSVRYLGDEIDSGCTVKAFPSLKKLFVDDMPNLEGLPHTNGKDSLPCLEGLTIRQCPKLTLLPRLLSLKNLELDGTNATMLSSIASLTSLSSLRISRIEELEFLPEGMLQHLNLLQTLWIENCSELRTLPSELENLTSLERLQIYCCDKFENLPEELCYLTSLKHLEIYQCASLTSLPNKAFEGLTSLEFLFIICCRKLTCLPPTLGHLTRLKGLRIYDAPALSALPEDLQHLTNLEELKLGGFDDRFTSLPEWLGCLTSLRALEIYKLSNVTSLPGEVGHLTQLNHLIISDVPSLSALPEDLQHLTNLEELKLGGFNDRFTSLPEWLGCLTSLRWLQISKLTNVTSLPRGLQHLSSLRCLRIENCPHLERRCRKHTGKDWPKIQHIPSVHIGNSFSQPSSSRWSCMEGPFVKQPLWRNITECL